MEFETLIKLPQNL